MIGAMMAGIMGVIAFMVMKAIVGGLITKDMTSMEQLLFSTVIPILVSIGIMISTVWIMSGGAGEKDKTIISTDENKDKEEQSSLWSIRDDDSYPRATFRGRVVSDQSTVPVPFQKGDMIISPSVQREEKTISVVDKELSTEKRGALTLRK